MISSTTNLELLSKKLCYYQQQTNYLKPKVLPMSDSMSQDCIKSGISTPRISTVSTQNSSKSSPMVLEKNMAAEEKQFSSAEVNFNNQDNLKGCARDLRALLEAEEEMMAIWSQGDKRKGSQNSQESSSYKSNTTLNSQGNLGQVENIQINRRSLQQQQLEQNSQEENQSLTINFPNYPQYLSIPERPQNPQAKGFLSSYNNYNFEDFVLPSGIAYYDDDSQQQYDEQDFENIYAQQHYNSMQQNFLLFEGPCSNQESSFSDDYYHPMMEQEENYESMIIDEQPDNYYMGARVAAPLQLY